MKSLTCPDIRFILMDMLMKSLTCPESSFILMDMLMKSLTCPENRFILMDIECHIPFITIVIFDCRSMTSALVICACVQSVWCMVCGVEFSTQVPLLFLQSRYVCALAFALGVSVPGADAQDGIYVYLTPLRNEFLFAWTGYNLLSKNPLGKPS